MEDKKPSQYETIFSMLREGPVTNITLSTVAIRYSAHIHELRKYLREHGQDIERSSCGGGVHQYRIVSLATAELTPVAL